MSMPGALRVTLAGVLVAALTAGCGGSSSDSASGMSKTEVTVGVLPIVDTAPFFIALKRGFFEDEGLTVNKTTIDSSPGGISKLQSGDMDISFSSYTAIFRAHAKGLKMHVLAEAYSAKPGVFVVLAKPGSDIRTAEDLSGKTIAVQSLSNVQTILIKSTLRTKGVNPKSVDFVKVPFPNLETALKKGEVDTVLSVEPFTTSIKRNLGGHVVMDVTKGPTANWPVAGYSVSQDFYNEHPKTAAAFKRAIQRASKVAHNRAAVEKILPTYTKITPETAAVMNLGTYPTTVDATRLQRVSDLMHKFGLIDTKVDAEELVS